MQPPRISLFALFFFVFFVFHQLLNEFLGFQAAKCFCCARHSVVCLQVCVCGRIREGFFFVNSCLMQAEITVAEKRSAVMKETAEVFDGCGKRKKNDLNVWLYWPESGFPSFAIMCKVTA